MASQQRAHSPQLKEKAAKTESSPFPERGRLRDEELARLRREVKRLRRENEILKKESAFFSETRPR